MGKPAVLHLIILLVLPCLAAASSAYPPPYGEGRAGSCEVVDVPLESTRNEEFGGGTGTILDITHQYREDMPAFDSDDGIGQYLRLCQSMKNGSLANLSEMKLTVHSGTHVDAPGHFFQRYFDSGFDVDTLDLHVLNGWLV